jgi:hypothetical protein
VALLVSITGRVLALSSPVVPAGARAVALEYRAQWIKSAKQNPDFYEMREDVPVDEVVIQDGFVHSILREADMVLFAKSPDADPLDFATEHMYEFPMLVQGAYVGSILVLPSSAAAGTDVVVNGFYFFGITFPGGALETAIERFAGFGPSSVAFSVVDFIGDSFGGSVVRLVDAGDVRFTAVNPEAVDVFSDGSGQYMPLPADRAVPLLKDRIR